MAYGALDVGLDSSLASHAMTIARKNPKLRGLMMGQHGLINWANDDKGLVLLSPRSIYH